MTQAPVIHRSTETNSGKHSWVSTVRCFISELNHMSECDIMRENCWEGWTKDTFNSISSLVNISEGREVAGSSSSASWTDNHRASFCRIISAIELFFLAIFFSTCLSKHRKWVVSVILSSEDWSMQTWKRSQLSDDWNTPKSSQWFTSFISTNEQSNEPRKPLEMLNDCILLLRQFPILEQIQTTVFSKQTSGF